LLKNLAQHKKCSGIKQPVATIHCCARSPSIDLLVKLEAGNMPLVEPFSDIGWVSPFATPSVIASIHHCPAWAATTIMSALQGYGFCKRFLITEDEFSG